MVNKDLILATLADKKTKLDVTLEVSPGYGYLAAKDRTAKKLSEIILDAAFSPVVRVNYKVETARVGRRADLDKLIIEIFTDATIKPRTPAMSPLTSESPASDAMTLKPSTPSAK